MTLNHHLALGNAQAPSHVAQHQSELERMSVLVRSALVTLHLDESEAECAAYEAGRYAYGLAATIPEAFAEHPQLAQAFERGRADVPADLAADERAEALAPFDF